MQHDATPVPREERNPAQFLRDYAKVPFSTPAICRLRCDADYGGRYALDRKSTRLNSSHRWISNAVFCFKKIGFAVRELEDRGRRAGTGRKQGGENEGNMLGTIWIWILIVALFGALPRCVFF